MAYLALFGRAFAIVTLTAVNVVNVAHGRYGWAFVTGWGISAVWWANSRTAAHSPLRGAWLAYSLGAGCGTCVGMAIGARL